MPQMTSEDFVSYYQQNFDVGTERLKELLPKDRVLDLDDFIQAPDQLWPDFASSLGDAERENLLDAWAKLRANPDPDREGLFLSVRDPSREHSVNPPPLGGPILPPRFSPTNMVLVSGMSLPLGDRLAALGYFEYGGDQVFVKHVARVNIENWVVTGGNVHFSLLEGPNKWGPWEPRCEFPLGPNERHTGCSFDRLAWWALVVRCVVPSKFTARPFAW